MVESARLFATFVDLCRIPSPSGHEGRVAEYVRQRVTALGLDVEEDGAGRVLKGECGNLIVHCLRGQGEPLFLAAHMDTVPVPASDQIPVIVEGDRVHTAGQSPLGGDDKAGVAVALELLAEAMESPGYTRPLEAIFTVREEQGAQGARLFDPRQVVAAQGFVLDGETPVGTAIRQASEKLRYVVEMQGRSAHAAVDPEKGINAIKAIGAVAAALPTGRLDRNSVANLGRIEGGGPSNVVPDMARLMGELRSLRRDSLQDIVKQIEETASREATRHGARATIAWEHVYPGYSVPTDALCSRLFVHACQAAGHEPVFLTTLAGGDANHFNSKGMTCMALGLGMEAIHTADEYMLLSRLAEAASLLNCIVGLAV